MILLWYIMKVEKRIKRFKTNNNKLVIRRLDVKYNEISWKAGNSLSEFHKFIYNEFTLVLIKIGPSADLQVINTKESLIRVT